MKPLPPQINETNPMIKFDKFDQFLKFSALHQMKRVKQIFPKFTKDFKISVLPVEYLNLNKSCEIIQ
jgi:hypothetical protein